MLTNSSFLLRYVLQRGEKLFGNTRFREKKILFLGAERAILETTTSGKVNIVKEIERIDAASEPYYDKGNTPNI